VQGNFFERVIHVAQSLPETHVPTLAVGVAAIVLFLVLEKAFPGRPTTLLVVGAAIAATRFLELDKLGIQVVGELPSGLPAIGLPPSISRISASSYRRQWLASCWPTARPSRGAQLRAEARPRDRSRSRTHGSGHGQHCDRPGARISGGRRDVTDRHQRHGGATSPLSLVFTSGAVMLTLLFFAGLFHDLPEPVLGAIVLMAAKHLVKVEELKEMRAASRSSSASPSLP